MSNLSSQALKQEVRNILAKLKDGKTLTAAQRKLLEDYERDQDGGDNKPVSVVDEEALIKSSDLADFLGISNVRIHELEKEAICVRKQRGFWYAARSIRGYIRMLQKNRKSKHGSGTATMEELRQKLVLEQGRKESALATLRELELEREQKSLVPEYMLVEKYIQTMTPLRRLLDALPRAVAHQANPGKPGVAEKAIRNALNERVFSEMARIEQQIEIEKSVDKRIANPDTAINEA